ncbi:MAG: diguanylate cyclase [Candidatus Eisenbacteria bacterium]|nr:diguanylate cyclase [Candidatus Eisenbacteria bacterium]
MAPREAHKTRSTTLVASTDPVRAGKLAGWLMDAGYLAILCDEPELLTTRAVSEGADLVVLDADAWPATGGISFERVDDMGRRWKPPVLVLGGDEQEHTGSCPIECFTYPTRPREFLTKVRALLRVSASIASEGDSSQRDDLTRLYSRHYFDKRLEKEVERARRYSRSVALVMIDVDGLKKTNKRSGHRGGDAVLKAVADVVLSGTRLSDIACRFGGDEIALILPETGSSDAAALSDRLRGAFSECVIRIDGKDVITTVSCGAACYPDDARDAETLVRMADSALCQAKEAGGDKSVVAFKEKDREDAHRHGAMARILLVEDNSYNRSVASLVLRSSGYEVIEAGDGVTAVALARATRPDLVIIDVQLHGMGGLEATRRMVELEEMENIPIVALTTRDVPEDLEQLVAAGCRGYITKPIDTNNLATAVSNYLGP